MPGTTFSVAPRVGGADMRLVAVKLLRDGAAEFAGAAAALMVAGWDPEGETLRNLGVVVEWARSAAEKLARFSGDYPPETYYPPERVEIGA